MVKDLRQMEGLERAIKNKMGKQTISSHFKLTNGGN